MNRHNNRRSEATKANIQQTLLTMLQEQELNKITVQALCEKAEINRSTFYNHYESPESVLVYIEHKFVTEFYNYVTQNTRPEQQDDLCHMLVQALTYLKTNRELCLVCLQPSLRSYFVERIFKRQFFFLLHRYHLLASASEEILPYAQTFLIAGCGQVVELWLQSGCKESPDEIASHVSNILENF